MDINEAQIAVLAENMYQELELWYPLLRLREAGANVKVVAPVADQVYASKLGYPVKADLAINEVEAEELDAVVIPGGFAPEGMRRSAPMISLVRKVHDQGNLVAAICHAGWVLASAGIAKGRRVTCVPIIKDDVVHAGGNYVDEPVVRDGNVITSRLPGDLPDFCREIVRYLEEAPMRRNAKSTLRAVAGRSPASADYDKPARMVTMPRGKASANYTMQAVSVEAQ
jgi:protease I